MFSKTTLLLLALLSCRCTSSLLPESQRVADAIGEEINEALYSYEGVGGEEDLRHLDSIARLASDPKIPAHLLVVFGGWGSCRPGPYGQQMFVPAMELGKTAYLISCFGKYRRIAHYYTSAEPRALRAGYVDELTAAVSEAAAAAGAAQITIIGHSHGGWLAMQVAHRLPPALHIQKLVTIDPISAIKCPPSRLVNWYYKRFSGLPDDHDCREPPSDVTAAMRRDLDRKTGVWANYYQRETFHLHSGEISEATLNKKMDFSGSEAERYLSHSRIAADLRVWTELKTLRPMEKI